MQEKISNLLPGISPAIREAAENVCRATGVAQPVYWATLKKQDDLFCAAFAFSPTEQSGILAAPGFERSVDQDELYAAICHEVGHIKYRDIYADRATHDYHEAEFRADRFVMQCGMAKGLLKIFNKRLRQAGLEYGLMPSVEHPPLLERMQRVKKFLDSRVPC